MTPENNGAPPTPADSSDVRRIAPADARALAEAGRAVLVDVRDRRLHQSAHAAGAVSLPLADLAAAAHDWPPVLPRDRLLIFYCA